MLISVSINLGEIWLKFGHRMLCSELNNQIHSWLRDYDKIQSFAVILIYIQIGCALVGSLGALYNGVLLINLGIALFALVAIESSSQSLGRTYAALLCCAILLDILWFLLFGHEIWNLSSEIYGPFAIFSVKLALSMQIIGFCVRLSSSLLWIQMYRLGVSYVDSTIPQESDLDLRNNFLNSAPPAIVRNSSGSDEVLGGSIYDPVYYSSLFEDGRDDGYAYGDHNLSFDEGGSTPISDTSQASHLKPLISRSFQAIKEEITIRKQQSV